MVLISFPISVFYVIDIFVIALILKITIEMETGLYFAFVFICLIFWPDPENNNYFKVAVLIILSVPKQWPQLASDRLRQLLHKLIHFLWTWPLVEGPSFGNYLWKRVAVTVVTLLMGVPVTLFVLIGHTCPSFDCAYAYLRTCPEGWLHKLDHFHTVIGIIVIVSWVWALGHFPVIFPPRWLKGIQITTF